MIKHLFILILFVSNFSFAQVYVNTVDLNLKVKSFELHMAKKPFTQSDCYYVDYGQNGFKEHFYDHKSQSILDSNNVKFEKGQYMKLLNYLDSQGWVKDSQRESELGDVKIKIILFRRKE